MEAWKGEVEKKPPSMSAEEAYATLNLPRKEGGCVVLRGRGGVGMATVLNVDGVGLMLFGCGLMKYVKVWKFGREHNITYSYRRKTIYPGTTGMRKMRNLICILTIISLPFAFPHHL